MAATDCTSFDNNNSSNATINEINDNNNNNLSILKYAQVRRLDAILNETLVICGECGLPTISVTIKDFILAVKHKLELYQFPMVDMRLNGGGAAAVLDPLNLYSYNDIDILVILDSSQILDEDTCFSDTIRAVIDVIADLLRPMSAATAALFTAHRISYIQKLVRIHNPANGDSWSLLGLGVSGLFSCKFCRIDIKFTHRMRRQFEFSIDSFQIVLDSLLIFYEALVKFSSGVYINQNFYPTVYVSSKWPSLTDALEHLGERHIITSQPEHIRGGGLLKYCKLLVQNFIVPDKSKIPKLERYMCSRFFIDYIDLNSQRKAIISYLKNHFQPNETHRFLETLKRVISSSSVCLMNHERQQTLCLIDQIAAEIESHVNLFPVRQTVICQSNFSGFNDLDWSIDTVIDGIILPEMSECAEYKCRSFSTVSSQWSTPVDMSPMDMAD